MNSGTQQEGNPEKQETSAMGRFQAVEFTLTQDQYIIIQHFLPKGYTLQQRKSTKREKGSSHKLIDAEMSRFSGGFENTEENQGRSKRARTKKIDRYLEQQMPRTIKRSTVQKLPLDGDMSQCAKILIQLKRHPSAVPFLDPVDPKKSGASHYFDVIKDPMDFYTIQRNLKSGQYHNTQQFHSDICKVWQNSFLYNEKSSKIFKMTVQMQKFYKKLLNQMSTKKSGDLKLKQKHGTQKMKTYEQKIQEENASISKNQDLKSHKGESFSNNDYDV